MTRSISTRRPIGVAFAACLVLAPAVAHAEPPEWLAERAEVAAHAGVAWRTDDAYALYGDRTGAPRGGLALAYDVVRMEDAFALSVQIGWTLERLEDDFAQDATAALTAHALEAGLLLRWLALPWLEPHARVAGGATFLRTEIGQPQGRTLDGSTWHGQLALGAGASVQTPAGALGSDAGRVATLSIGLRVEGGYLLAPSASLAAGADPGPDGIDTHAADLGALPRSAPYLRFAFFAHF